MDLDEAPVKETKKQKEAAEKGFERKHKLIHSSIKPMKKAKVKKALKEAKEAVEALKDLED